MALSMDKISAIAELRTLPGAVGTPATVTFNFPDVLPSTYNASSLEGQTFQPLSEAARNVVRQAITYASEIANITFTELPGTSRTFIATADYSGTSTGGFAAGRQNIWIDRAIANDSDPTQLREVFLHELGHTLGLKHPFQGSPNLPPAEDNWQYTLMAYEWHPTAFGMPTTYLLYDIAALQYLYGANTSTRTGDDVYTWSPFVHDVLEAIWDGGGNDTIDASPFHEPATINLEAGSFSSIFVGEDIPQLGIIAGSNNVAIAYGVTIENAIGGDRDDIFYGNAVANILRGNAGNDTFNGKGGADTLIGGLGADKYILNGIALSDAASGIIDRLADYAQGSGIFDALEEDVIELSAILAAAFGGGHAPGTLVRLVEDTSLKFSRLQVDADGTANGVQWTTLALLDGIHASHTAKIAFTGVHSAAVGVQTSIGNYVDFGGQDGSDLLWRSDSGGLAIWHMNGGSVGGADDLGIIDSSWTIFGTGDFNGDGKGDMVWRHDGGALALWMMDGGSVSAVADLGVIAGSWQIIGVGDFNGDGKSDLLWRDANGFTALWLMDGGSVTAVGSLGTVDPSWHVIGLADTNGDTKSDMIWRNDAGFLAIWQMDGGSVTTVNSLGTISNDWHIVGAGDFNGDGKADLVWRNDAGALVIWEMNGGTVTAVDNLGLIGDNWHIAGVGDFNDDGKADLMWNSDAGAAALWLMNGGVVTEVGDLGAIGQNWATVNHHYDFV